jgi:V/A-type H+-transporting ATPase subunit K
MFEWIANVFTGQTLAVIGIFIAVGLPCVGSAKGVGIVGEAGAGLMTEDPSRFAQILVLQVIPSTNGIYGFVAGMMAMNQLNIFGGQMYDLTFDQGGLVLFACMPVGIVAWLACIAQARITAGVVGMIAKRPEEMAKGILVAVMVEFFAIISLLVTILLLISLPIQPL